LAPLQGSLQGDPQARMRIRENISNLYLLRLTRALDLTEEQTAKLYPLLTRVEKEKAGIQRRMGQDLRDLRSELAKTGAGEQRVLELVARVRDARLAIRQKDDEVEGVLDGVLTPVQRARYLVFTVDFLRSIGQNLEKARGLRAPIKRTP
ncbi:MAG: Spy/CpxP family protein refolding chaperone, partial [Candidatus Aminicenantes bacterium]|nr:Spy/CpxP family protein refolding chaperone [Candidatus Aminicenantes bacterium]